MLKYATIGTAGHVDHGKTSLVKALTGIDTDRLAEEKKRGITIENGFAHLDLPGGNRVGIVDVPGHEKFIKNMLAGSGGLDLAMLIIAADDGVMPQTREHLEILRLLNIKEGIMVLTKCDLIDDPDWLELLEDDLRALVQDTFLAEAPIVRASAHTGQGLDELKEHLVRLLNGQKSRSVGQQFRLPIDRVFTMTGFGTVVTGTLLEGTLEVGESAMLYPEERQANIRRLQVHSQTVEKAYPGQRVAVNIANLKKEEVNRGEILASLNSLTPTRMLDVHLSVVKDSPFAVKSGRLVHLYLGSTELLAKIVLMEDAELTGGQSGYAQLRLVEPVTAKKGDRFVVRFYSPMVTVGGGEILDAKPLKRRRHKEEVLKQFATKATGTHLARVELAVMERPGTFNSLADLIARADLDPQQAKNDAHTLSTKGVLVPLTKGVFIHRREMDMLVRKTLKMLTDWHQAQPYSPGLSLEEARQRLVPGASQSVADSFFKILEDDKSIRREGSNIRLATFIPQVNEAENEMVAKLEELYLSYGVTPLVTSAVEPAANQAADRQRKAAFASLVRQGLLVKLDDSYYIHQSIYEKALAQFKELAQSGQPVILGPFRDALNTSRKVAVALLDSFDRSGITTKSGEGRLLRKN